MLREREKKNCRSNLSTADAFVELRIDPRVEVVTSAPFPGSGGPTSWYDPTRLEVSFIEHTFFKVEEQKSSGSEKNIYIYKKEKAVLAVFVVAEKSSDAIAFEPVIGFYRPSVRIDVLYKRSFSSTVMRQGKIKAIAPLPLSWRQIRDEKLFFFLCTC